MAIIEGPFLAIIAGFLISLKLLNFFIVFLIVVLGDIIGDGMMYILGRWGGKPLINKIGPFLGITDQKLAEAKAYFTHRHTRAVALSKVIHGVGFVGLITAGILKMPYRRFAVTCLLVSMTQVALMLLIGIVFGHAYVLLSKYLNYYATAVSITAVIIITMVIFIKIKNRKK